MRAAYVWFTRPGIGRRIALAMVVALVAVHLEVFFQLALFAHVEMRMTGTRWAAETEAAAARAAFAVPAGQREAVLRAVSRNLPVRLAWSQMRPAWRGERASPVGARLAATVRLLLGEQARAVDVTLAPLHHLFSGRVVRVAVVPASVADQLGTAPLRTGEPDILIPSSVRVAVQGADGTWVSMVPVSYAASGLFSRTRVVTLTVGGAIIALLSALTARRIMAPLNRLLVAANRVGSSREVVGFSDPGLGEFAPVAQAFEDMQRRLLGLVDDRTQMLAAISHDLRSALTRLRIAAETCGGEAERQAVVAEIEDMQTMVESTLTFASGEARMTPSRTLDVAALLISLVDEAADSGRPCTYAGPDHAELRAHPVALKRAFSNLIDNAIKYGGAARVGLRCQDTLLLVRVEDDGPGISPHLAEEAFLPFRRLDPSRSNEVPGVGLGLTIARDVVQSHGGGIRLAARVAGPFAVEVTLPAMAG